MAVVVVEVAAAHLLTANLDGEHVGGDGYCNRCRLPRPMAQITDTL